MSAHVFTSRYAKMSIYIYMCRAYFLYSENDAAEVYVRNYYEKYPGCKLPKTSWNVVIAEYLELEGTGTVDL